jgi:energy-converting hydrogenase B subunit D
MVLAAATLVVLVPNLSGAVMALSAMGTVLTVLFLLLAAPDVAEAEAVVGAIALPVLYLVAIGKIRTDVPDRGTLGESEDSAGG